MNTAKKISDLKNRHGNTKKILLVEGPGDIPIISRLLDVTVSGWSSGWVIDHAGKKDHVLKILKNEPGWRGLVDRDEWDISRIAQEQASLPNLMVLPRFTIENFLVDPKEIWVALPPQQQDRFGGRHVLESAIAQELPQWIRHGVLWHVVTPLWSGLRNKGFKESLASETSLEISQDDQQIEAKLQEWHSLLSPLELMGKFRDTLATANGQTREAQLSIWVHGKHFWEKAVYPILTAHLGAIPMENLRKNITNAHPGSPDIARLLNEKSW